MGSGVVRGFRAETTIAAPKIESELHFERGRLKGTITNRSDADVRPAPSSLVAAWRSSSLDAGDRDDRYGH